MVSAADEPVEREVMSLLLNPVHYIPSDGPRRGKCCISEVAGHGVESVDLIVDENPEDFTWTADAERMFQTIRPCDVKFDPSGKEGTFHFSDDCPVERRERERQAELKRWLERYDRRRTNRKIEQ
jgi:hypothetical protein